MERRKSLGFSRSSPFGSSLRTPRRAATPYVEALCVWVLLLELTSLFCTAAVIMPGSPFISICTFLSLSRHRSRHASPPPRYVPRLIAFFPTCITHCSNSLFTSLFIQPNQPHVKPQRNHTLTQTARHINYQFNHVTSPTTTNGINTKLKLGFPYPNFITVI